MIAPPLLTLQLMVHITKKFYINIFRDRDSRVRCAVLGNVCVTPAKKI